MTGRFDTENWKTRTGRQNNRSLKGKIDARDSILAVGEKPFLRNDDRDAQDSSIVALKDFIPNGAACCFLIRQNELRQTTRFFTALAPVQRRNSLTLVCLQPREQPPCATPAGTIFLQNCADEALREFVRFAQGDARAHVLPDWFFPRASGAQAMQAANRLREAWMRVKPETLLKLHAEAFAEVYARHLHRSKRSLMRDCERGYGAAPGEICRIPRTFSQTAELMREEARLAKEDKRRYGNSPLTEKMLDDEINPGYLKTLKSVTGLTYNELREASEKEHWMAVWVRAWRNISG